MAIIEGRDYVLARSMTYTGSGGVGKGCLAGTMELLLLLPSKVHRGGGRRIEEVDIYLQGESVPVYLENFLRDPGRRPVDLNQGLRDLAEKVDGSRLIDLSRVRRLKVRTSFFSRGIYLSENNSGPGWTGLPLMKQDAAAFRNFYQGHPASAGT